jgi:hypothetical protein
MLEVTRRSGVDLDGAMAWTHAVLVQRYCADFEQTTEEGELCFTSFKQFLVVCARSETPRVPSSAIDDMWHTALLFSRSYLAYCEQFLGEIVHHDPIAGTADADVYAATREDARALFGELPAVYWPQPADAKMCGSMYIP